MKRALVKLIKLSNGLAKIYLKLALIKLKKLRDPGSSPATLVADAEELNAEEPDEDILEACADQAEGPRFESKLYLWSTPKNLLSIHRLKLYL